MVESYDELVAAAFKKKHGFDSTVMVEARNRIRKVAKKSPKRGKFDPANVDIMGIPWRCLSSALSGSVLRRWELYSSKKYFAVSTGNKKVALFTERNTISIFDSSSSDSNGKAIVVTDHPGFFDDLFLMDNVLLRFPWRDGLVQGWSTETGDLLYELPIGGRGDRFTWARSRDRVYALEEKLMLYTFDAQTGHVLDSFLLEIGFQQFTGADPIRRIFVCGKWLVACNAATLLVFDLKTGHCESTFTDFPNILEHESLDVIVQASDDEFTFYVSIFREKQAFFVLACAEKVGTIQLLRELDDPRSEGIPGILIAATKGFAVVQAGSKLFKVCNTGAQKLCSNRNFRDCINSALVLNHRRELLVLSTYERNSEVFVYGLDEPSV